MYDVHPQPSLMTVLQLRDAVARIDEMFGPGFAKKNPSLVSAYIRAAALNENARINLQIAHAQTQAVK